MFSQNAGLGVGIGGMWGERQGNMAQGFAVFCLGAAIYFHSAVTSSLGACLLAFPSSIPSPSPPSTSYIPLRTSFFRSHFLKTVVNGLHLCLSLNGSYVEQKSAEG